MGYKACCVVYSSPVGGRGDGSPGTNLGSSAIWHNPGGDVGQDRQAGDPGSWTGSAARLKMAL